MYKHLSLLYFHMRRWSGPTHAVGPGRAEPEPGPPSSQSASEAQMYNTADAAKAKAAAVKAEAAAAEADDFLSVLFSFLFTIGHRASRAVSYGVWGNREDS